MPATDQPAAAPFSAPRKPLAVWLAGTIPLDVTRLSSAVTGVGAPLVAASGTPANPGVSSANVGQYVVLSAPGILSDDRVVFTTIDSSGNIGETRGEQNRLQQGIADETLRNQSQLAQEVATILRETLTAIMRDFRVEVQKIRDEVNSNQQARNNQSPGN
jgi:hypothetical protein